MTVAIMVVVIAGISTVSLMSASKAAIDLKVEAVHLLGDQQSAYWEGFIGGYIRVLRTAAAIMGNFEDMPADQRRDHIEQMMQSVFYSETNMYNLYTIWMPNALDGMDAQFIDRVGSSPTGQFALAFSRETGEVARRTSTDIADTMAYLATAQGGRVRKEDPFLRTVIPGLSYDEIRASGITGSQTLLVRIMVPIFNTRNNEIVGGLAILLTVDLLQEAVEQTLRESEEIAAMSIYSSAGIVLASHVPEHIGSTIPSLGIYGKNEAAIMEALRAGEDIDIEAFSPSLGTNLYYVFTSFPIETAKTS